MVEPDDLPPEIIPATAPTPAPIPVIAPTVAPVTVMDSVVNAPISIAKGADKSSVAADLTDWEELLELEARNMLELGRTDVWNTLIARAESRLILAALANTKGRRIEAANQLGIGRNTITRKIQELGLE